MNTAIIRLADKVVGGLLSYCLGWFVQKESVSHPKKILVIQLWGIGETVLTLPSISALRERFPDAHLEVLVTERNKEVYTGVRGVDQLVVLGMNPFHILKFISKKKKKYDLVVDLEEYLNISAFISFFVGKFRVGYAHGLRSRVYQKKVVYKDDQHCAQTFLDMVNSLGARAELKRLCSLHYSSKDRKIVDSLLKRFGLEKGEKIVGIAPGAAESAKCRMWPFSRFAEVSNHLLEGGNTKIVFTGTKAEKELIQSIIAQVDRKEGIIDLSGKLSLPQLFYFLEKCAVFLGNDSGPMHIAAAQGTRTIGLFGPNLPERFGPFGKGNIGIYKGRSCEFSPCINVHLGEVPDCLYPKRSKDYQKCMKNISVSVVVEEVTQALRKS